MPIDTNPWYYVTFLGDPRVWFSIAVIFFVARLYSKYKNVHHFQWVGKFIIFSGFGMGAAFGFSEILKHIFQVHRACIETANQYCKGIGTFSFPSSHTVIAFAVFVGIFYMIKQSKKKPNPYIWLWIFIIPVFVGLSRVVLGVHTYLDIVGGGITGVLITVFYIEIISRIAFLRKMWTAKKKK